MMGDGCALVNMMEDGCALVNMMEDGCALVNRCGVYTDYSTRVLVFVNNKLVILTNSEVKR